MELVPGAAWQAEEGTCHAASNRSESETSDPCRCRENRGTGGVCASCQVLIEVKKRTKSRW